jgi:hypothetical protein
MATLLIANIDEFKQHVALNASTDEDYFALLQPDLLLAEHDHLRPALGEDFFDELLAAASAEATELRRLLAFSLANLTMVSFLDVAQVQISGSGVQIISTDHEKTAFQWQINALKANLSRKGFNGLEKALAYLERHAADFPTWASSETAQRARGQFIATASEFSTYYNISNARLTFQALASLLPKTESFRLAPALGADFFEELKQQLRTATLTPENEQLVTGYLRPALAHLTMAQAIGELGFSLNGQNLELNVYRFDDSNSKESDPGLTQLLDMKAGQALHDGERYLRRLVTHLNATASATRYATYFASPTYAAPAVPNYHTTSASAPLFLGF